MCQHFLFFYFSFEKSFLNIFCRINFLIQNEVQQVRLLLIEVYYFSIYEVLFHFLSTFEDIFMHFERKI